MHPLLILLLGGVIAALLYAAILYLTKDAVFDKYIIKEIRKRVP
jgi:hypothetical protein